MTPFFDELVTEATIPVRRIDLRVPSSVASVPVAGHRKHLCYARDEAISSAAWCAGVRMSVLSAAGQLRRRNVTMLKLYGFSKVNAVARGHTRDLRVLWALEEMQLPFELAGMDHPAHDLNTEAYRRLSPFEQIPSIDDDGLVLSESAAILVYLAKKCGRLIPAIAPARRRCCAGASPR